MMTRRRLHHSGKEEAAELKNNSNFGQASTPYHRYSFIRVYTNRYSPPHLKELEEHKIWCRK